jgi:regulator of sigma E protease
MASLTDPIAFVLSYLLPFLVVVVVIIVVHELGHFWVARRCGVTVETFSLGIGKELFHFHDRHGTRWRLAALPIGGYVKFLGDKDAASAPDESAVQSLPEDQRSRTLAGRPLSQRAAIVAAGPIANFLLAILLLSGDARFNGTDALRPIVEDVVPGSPAERAGLRSGDLVTSVRGNPVTTFAELQAVIAANPNTSLALTVQRGSAEIMTSVVPEAKSRKGIGGSAIFGVIGIKVGTGESNLVHTDYSTLEALGYGTGLTFKMIADNAKGILLMIMGYGSTDDLAGPITLAELSGDTARAGLSTFIRFIAVISISIGFVNLLPIPILDGGHLLFYALEAVRGRPMSARSQEYGFRVGMAIVLSLMAFAFISDILKKLPA